MYQARWGAALALTLLLCTALVAASLGDRLPEFRECVDICIHANCGANPTPIPLHRRLLLWTCPSECDYVCQHIITDRRHAFPHAWQQRVHQYHGKWPFYRLLGIQEPFSVLFSLANYLAHAWGLAYLRERVPAAYALRRYYVWLGYVGLASWAASMIFHARDFVLTERADYFAAGASVLYGLYVAPVRIFHLDGGDARRVAGAGAAGRGGKVRQPQPQHNGKPTLLRLWTGLCALLYAAHVGYLSLWRWDYGYNMGANIGVGMAQNVLWCAFAYAAYARAGRGWHNVWRTWPAMIVVWVVCVMSLEVFDFVPWRLMVDAHSLWHAGTVVPTVWWYLFLVRDAQDDMRTAARIKA